MKARVDLAARDAGGDSGIATIWALAVAMACLLMAGLVLDGGAILRARSSSYDLAGGAARAGAQELDQPALAEGSISLDPDSARRAALTWLDLRDASGTVVVDNDIVTVTVRRQVELQLLRPASVTVTETASSQAQRGGTGS